MTPLDPDPIAVLEALVSGDVRFVVIGGLAAVVLGSPIVTRDVDICYDRSLENVEALAAVLMDLGAILRGAPEDVPFVFDVRTLLAGDTFTFSTRWGALDCLGTPAGSDGYEELIANAIRVDIDGIEIFVASIDDLIRMKRAAGRPKDLAAVAELEALRDELDAP